MKQLTIISGKGGTGKTSLTACFAVLERESVIIDCDVDAANLYLLLNPIVEEKGEFVGSKVSKLGEGCISCGKCEEACRFDAISDSLRQPIIDPITCEGCGVCVEVCPVDALTLIPQGTGDWYSSKTDYGPMIHAKLYPGGEGSGYLVTFLRQKGEDLAYEQGIDTIIIDGPPGIGCPVIASLAGVDLALIVTEPTLSGISDFQRALALADHFGVYPLVCINKCDLNLEMTSEIRDFCKREKVDLVGEVPYDPVFTEAMMFGKTVIEYSQNEVSHLVEDIWKRIRKYL